MAQFHGVVLPMNDMLRLQLFRQQLLERDDATLMISRKLAVWLFDCAADGITARAARAVDGPERLPRTVVMAVAPAPRRKRRNDPGARP